MRDSKTGEQWTNSSPSDVTVAKILLGFKGEATAMKTHEHGLCAWHGAGHGAGHFIERWIDHEVTGA